MVQIQMYFFNISHNNLDYAYYVLMPVILGQIHHILGV